MALTKTQVKELQKILKDKGHYTGKLDGDFGSGTFDAVKKALTTPPKKDVVTPGPTPNTVTVTVSRVIKTADLPLWSTIDSKDANTLKGKDRPYYAKRVLMSLGWKDYQAAALVGQFMQESYADLKTEIWGDKHTAYGIAQWRDNYVNGKHTPGRLTQLFKFAQGLKRPLGDLDTQVRFAHWELTSGEEVSVGRKLIGSKNVVEAVDAAIGFERPRGYSKENPRNGHGYANRLAFAKSLL